MPTAISPTTAYSATFVPFHLQLVGGAHVQQAQAQEHERDAVEDDVAHWSLTPHHQMPVAPARSADDESYYPRSRCV